MGTYDRTDDLIASYSSKGPSFGDFVVKPDLVAPGNQVVSLLAPGATLLQYPADQVPVSYYKNAHGASGFRHLRHLLDAEWNQHGYCGGQRRRCGPSAGAADSYARSGEGSSYEDG